MDWSVLRLALYGIGVISSALLAGRLLSINHIIAKLWGISQIVWCLVCSALIISLWEVDFGPGISKSRVWMFTIIAALLATCPLVVYLGWGTNGGLKE